MIENRAMVNHFAPLLPTYRHSIHHFLLFCLLLEQNFKVRGQNKNVYRGISSIDVLSKGSISRILYPASRVAIISLVRRLPDGSSGLPARLGTSSPCIRRCTRMLGLAPAGGCLAGHVTASAGRLLPCLFTLTHCWAVCFCGPAPWVAPPGCYPAACSMEFGLSSIDSRSIAIA